MPWSKVLTFTDPFPYQAAIRAADIELYPTARGEFRAELTQINLNQLWMQRFNENLPLIYASKLRPGRRAIGFLTTDQQPGKQHCGVEVSPHDIVVSKYDVMHHRTRGNNRYGTMSLATDDFDTACKAVIGCEISGFPLKHIVRPAPDLMSRLVKLHEMVDQIARTTPDLLALSEVARSLEQNLIHVMVRCLADGEDLRNDRRRPPPRCDRRSVRGISRSSSRYAAVFDRNLRGDCSIGADASRRLRGASGNGPDPLSRPCEGCTSSAVHCCERTLLERPLPNWQPTMASGSWGASRAPTNPCLASSPRNPCGGPRNTGQYF